MIEASQRVYSLFMGKTVVGSILHGAYGDLYEQAICLKHYALTHPEVELRLFAVTPTRLSAFEVLDLSFAASFELWTEIERQPAIKRFFQFQVKDGELNAEVLDRLAADVLAKIDRETNHLPWVYMRDHRLLPPAPEFQLGLSALGQDELKRVMEGNRVPANIWERPTIGFLWRYRTHAAAISAKGQKPQEVLVRTYSALFQDLIREFDCHLLICGMNVVTDEKNRERTDSKYPSFGLDLLDGRATYMQGLSWPLELEITSRATVCCGHASGFTEGLWLKRELKGAGSVVLMDAPPHYLAKAGYHRMGLFGLNNPLRLAEAMWSRSPESYRGRIARLLRKA